MPNKYTIQRLVERFRETGSTGEKHRSGRPSVLSNNSLEDIRARLLQSPRKLENFPNKLDGSIQRATERLKLHPYRVLLPHGLRNFWITLYKSIIQACMNTKLPGVLLPRHDTQNADNSLQRIKELSIY
jgi:hypothetical protein